MKDNSKRLLETPNSQLTRGELKQKKALERVLADPNGKPCLAGNKKFHAMCGEEVTVAISTGAKNIPVQAHNCPRLLELIKREYPVTTIPRKDLVDTKEEVILWQIQHMK